MTASARIGQLLEYYELNAKQFSERIGDKRPQRIYDVQKGKAQSISTALSEQIISAFPEVSKAWLLTGEGEMLKEDAPVDDVDELIEAPGEVKSTMKMIPFYDAETTGGYDGLVSSSIESASLSGYINAGDWFDGRETAAIRHVGDSMVEYPDGCILAVRQVRNMHLLIPGRNYVVETDEYRVTKRVQLGKTDDYIMLYSSNQQRYDDGRLIHEPFPVGLCVIRRIFSILGYIVNQSGEARLIRP